MKTVFGTNAIAQICSVAPRTVAKWIDLGLLRGWRIPGSRNRRVNREVLEKFLAEHGMPSINALNPPAEMAASLLAEETNV